MGWFDEQIRQRIQNDDEAFSDAFVKMAGVIMGERLNRMLQDDRIKTKNAIEEILKYYYVKPKELPDNITTTLDQLEFLMRPAGIMWRTVELEGAWYKDAVGAMLGTRREDGSAVALIPSGLSGYDFLDIQTGKRVKVTKATADLIDTQALCFYKPLPPKAIGMKELVQYVIETARVSDIVFVSLATLAVTLIGLLPPYINRMIYSEVLESQSVSLLLSTFTFLLCATLAQTLIRVYNSLVMNRLSTRMNIAFEAAGMVRMLSLPPSFFKKYSAGELSARMGYVGTICTSLVQSLLSVGLSSVFSLVYVGQMLRFGPGLVVPGMIIILLTVGISVLSTVVNTRLSKKIMEKSAAESGMTYALVTGVQKIKLAGAEKRAFARWANAYAPVAKFSYDPPMILKLVSVFSTSISLIGTLVIYFFTIRTGVSLADYYAFNAAYGMVLGAFSSLVGMVSTFARIKPMMEMVEPILGTAPEIDESKQVVTRLSGGIELNNISFRYSEDMPMVLDNISLKIRPGQYVAIVGKTGCGKSTLMRLLLGFEKPLKGAVYYDGRDLETLDKKSVRRKIGVVMQDGKLFQGDIFSNITISAPWLTMDEAWEAAEMSGIAEDIRHMPMGMHTLISEGSGGVSGGQRQRLLIARAIAPKPKVLMFDEATSALDNITQKTVSQSLDHLKCTRIVIAHRLSTIRQCDRIIVLDQGRIMEDGSYDELIAKDGYFAELVARQRLDDEAFVARTTLF